MIVEIFRVKDHYVCNLISNISAKKGINERGMY